MKSFVIATVLLFGLSSVSLAQGPACKTGNCPRPSGRVVVSQQHSVVVKPHVVRETRKTVVKEERRQPVRNALRRLVGR